MDLSRVMEIAEEICTEFDYPMPSKIVLDKRYRYRMAYTNCDKRIIRMNAYLVENNPEAVIRAVLIHEIVHFKYCHHGPSFVTEVRHMGSHEKVQTMFELINLPFKYIYRCPVCNSIGYGDTIRDTSCGNCTREYDERYKLVLIKINEV